MTTLRVLSAGAAQAVVTAFPEVALGGETATVAAAFGPVGAMRDRFLGGEPCDLIILSRGVIDDLSAAGQVVGGSTTSIGRVPTALAVRRFQARPDISDGSGLRSALLGADVIHLADIRRSTAGAHFVTVLAQLGLAEVIGPRLLEHPSGAVAMRELAISSGNALGCTQLTEIVGAEGVDVVGPLPGEYGLTTDYVGAVTATTDNPEIALAFLRLLSGTPKRQLRREAGFEVD
jgi:molybdate transport system substrate-binding protein